MVLPQFWQVTPVALAALVVGTAHEVGRQRLARRQTDAHRRARWHRSLAFYAGLVLLALVASGPLNRWSMSWLSVHMVMHVLEMFYLPPLLILGAPWVPPGCPCCSPSRRPAADGGCAGTTCRAPGRCCAGRWPR